MAGLPRRIIKVRGHNCLLWDTSGCPSGGGLVPAKCCSGAMACSVVPSFPSLEQETERLQQEPVAGIDARVDAKNLRYFHVIIAGPSQVCCCPVVPPKFNGKIAGQQRAREEEHQEEEGDIQKMSHLICGCIVGWDAWTGGFDMGTTTPAVSSANSILCAYMTLLRERANVTKHVHLSY